jgi:hypothetical protein
MGNPAPPGSEQPDSEVIFVNTFSYSVRRVPRCAREIVTLRQGIYPQLFQREIPVMTLKEVPVVLVWILVALLLLFAIVGGVALSKFLFFILIVAAVVALIGFFARTA